MSIQVFDRTRENHVFSLYPASTSFAKNILSAFFILCASIQFCLGQNPPTSFRLNPTEFEDEDTIDLEIDYGTSTNQATNVLSVTFVYECIGFTVDPSSSLSLDLTNSWFNTDPYWTAEVSISSGGDSITVTLERTNNQSVEGYGEIAIAKGILVDIEDIVSKREEKPGLTLLYVENTQSSIDFAVFPNPATTQIQVELHGDSNSAKITLFDSSGRMVFTRKKDDPTQKNIDISFLSTGLYVIQVELNGELHQKKLMIN